MIGLRFFPLKSADVRGEGTRDARLRMSAGEAMRHDELYKTTATRFTPDSSFQSLFDERLKHMPGKRENVQITINDDVENMLGNASNITTKTHDPFKMTVPKLDNDMYEYMIYTLLQNSFTILSTQTIANVGARLITHNEQSFKNYKAGALKLNTFFLDKQFPIKQRGDNTCMVDFVWHHCKNKKGVGMLGTVEV